MRAALYARYSTDLQRKASIEDQVRICRARADREGWAIVEIYSDHATSGATTLRPGYQALMAALRNGGIDVVLAESLDRFSRDLEHIAAFYKQCAFHHVRIHTVAEGEISELHVGLRGTMGALYLKDLADKTRRGLEGRVLAGRATGAPAYGYTVVHKTKENGEPDRGLRQIDPEQAATVRRIFEAYAAGASPRQIARTLNAEGIHGPRNGVWFASTIRGRAIRSDGLLRNELYVGRLVWRRRMNAKDPVSGVRVRRDSPSAGRVIVEVPHLRIVANDLWERVQGRLLREAAPVQGRTDGGQRAFWLRRRPRHLLSGKAFCGVCGRTLSLMGRDYMGCKAAAHGTCHNRRTIRRPALEERVMQMLRQELMQPELVAEFVAQFNREWKALLLQAKAQDGADQRERLLLDRKIANLVAAISDGRSSPAIMARLAELEAETARLGERVPATESIIPILPANLGQVYAARIQNLQAAFVDREHPEALEAARSLIDRVILHPPPHDGDPPRVELVGELVSMLAAAGMTSPAPGVQSRPPKSVLFTFVSSVKAAPGAKP